MTRNEFIWFDLYISHKHLNLKLPHCELVILHFYAFISAYLKDGNIYLVTSIKTWV